MLDTGEGLCFMEFHSPSCRQVLVLSNSIPLIITDNCWD